MRLLTRVVSGVKRNAVVFPDRPDYRFELSEDNDVIASFTLMRRTANRMIEEAMITANIYCWGRALQRNSVQVCLTFIAVLIQKKLDIAMRIPH